MPVIIGVIHHVDSDGNHIMPLSIMWYHGGMNDRMASPNAPHDHLIPPDFRSSHLRLARLIDDDVLCHNGVQSLLSGGGESILDDMNDALRDDGRLNGTDPVMEVRVRTILRYAVSVTDARDAMNAINDSIVHSMYYSSTYLTSLTAVETMHGGLHDISRRTARWMISHSPRFIRLDTLVDIGARCESVAFALDVVNGALSLRYPCDRHSLMGFQRASSHVIIPMATDDANACKVDVGHERFYNIDRLRKKNYIIILCSRDHGALLPRDVILSIMDDEDYPTEFIMESVRMNWMNPDDGRLPRLSHIMDDGVLGAMAYAPMALFRFGRRVTGHREPANPDRLQWDPKHGWVTGRQEPEPPRWFHH